jgi:hypothetical protein
MTPPDRAGDPAACKPPLLLTAGISPDFSQSLRHCVVRLRADVDRLAWRPPPSPDFCGSTYQLQTNVTRKHFKLSEDEMDPQSKLS